MSEPVTNVAPVLKTSGDSRIKIIMRWLFAFGMCFAGVHHFTDADTFVAIMPPYLPAHLELVYVSGVFEILGGIGLLLPMFRRWAGWGLVALLLAVFPANIHMLVNDVYFGDMPHHRWLLWVRLPVQFLAIALTLWVANISLKVNWKQVIPWVVTAIVLIYLGATTDFAVVWNTLKSSNIVGFIPVVIGVCAVVYVVDCGCLVLLFKRFNAPVTFKEMLPLKGASYLLNVINYNAAAAGIALFFRNRKRVPFLESLSSMLWLNFIDIVALSTLMLAALSIGGGALGAHTRTILIGLGVGIYAILIGSCIYWNAGFDFFFLGRLRSWRIFTTFRKATLSDYATFIGIRTAFVMTYVVSQWLAMPFFNFDAGLAALFVYVPALTFVGTIPLTTVAGLGAVQVLMRDFYVEFAPAGLSTQSEIHSAIDAYSTTTILAFVVCRVIIGCLCMRQVTVEMGDRPESDANDTTPHLDESIEASK
jgi:uncharacterized membrane protein